MKLKEGTTEDIVEKGTMAVAQRLSDKKGLDIKILDLRGIHAYLDFMIVCSAQSGLHLKNLMKESIDAAKANGFRPAPFDSAEYETGWTVVDFGDFIVHLFKEELRDHYDLEGLWAQAEILEFTDAAV